jgi:hypothetical protein
LTFPVNGQATDAANGGATTAGDKAFFWITHPVDLVEVGALVGVATLADTFAFTVSRAPAPGGTFATLTNAAGQTAVVTGPVATIIPIGTRLKKDLGSIRLNAGDVLRFSVTDASATGAVQFYALCYPAGEPATGSEIVISTT